MFLIIFENGGFYKYESVSDDDLQAVSDGFCDIIDLINLTYFSDGEWIDIKEG
jgi:hypothetical protein